MLANLATAAVVGAALGALGRALPGSWAVWLQLLATLAALGYSFAEFAGRGASVPSSSWRVPQGWSRRGDIAYAVAFGASLGPGVLTQVTFAGFYILLTVCILARDPLVGAGLLGLFAFGRSLPIVAIGETASNSDRDGLRVVAQANLLLRDFAGQIATARAAVLALTAVLLVMSAVRD
jgi:hypothetical protein